MDRSADISEVPSLAYDPGVDWREPQGAELSAAAGAAAAGARLTANAFERLLARLGTDREAAAHEYERIRRRLVAFFSWHGSGNPESDADESIDRVAQRLERTDDVGEVRAYVHGVAKMVLLESTRRRAREESVVRELRFHVLRSAAPDESRIRNLERCLQELPEVDRAFILRYYQGAGAVHLAGRKRLADELGLSYAVVKAKAHRIRGRLQGCLRRRIEQGDDGEP